MSQLGAQNTGNLAAPSESIERLTRERDEMVECGHLMATCISKVRTSAKLVAEGPAPATATSTAAAWTLVPPVDTRTSGESCFTPRGPCQVLQHVFFFPEDRSKDVSQVAKISDCGHQELGNIAWSPVKTLSLPRSAPKRVHDQSQPSSGQGNLARARHVAPGCCLLGPRELDALRFRSPRCLEHRMASQDPNPSRQSRGWFNDSTGAPVGRCNHVPRQAQRPGNVEQCVKICEGSKTCAVSLGSRASASWLVQVSHHHAAFSELLGSCHAESCCSSWGRGSKVQRLQRPRLQSSLSHVQPFEVNSIKRDCGDWRVGPAGSCGVATHVTS